LALAPDGKTFATTADADRAEHALWDVATRKKVRVLYKENFYGRVIAFSPDGRMLAMAGHLLKGNEGEVHIWDLGAVKAPRIITASQRIDALAFSPDGSKLVVGASEKPTLEIWDPIRGALLKKLDNAPETSCLAYCPDGSIFIAAGLKSGSTVYDGESFERKRSFDKTGPALNARACFSEGGRMLFMIAGDSHASVWDTRHFKGEELP
jgi:WD40 repeat protein